MRKAPELDYRSFLANDMRDYLDYLDHLGFSILAPAYRLKPIDRFLADHNITCIQQCDSRLWLSLLSQHQGRIKAITFAYWRRAFHKFCRYLVVQGRIAENPAVLFPLPNRQPYRPYVFSLQELHRIFDFLQQKADRCTDPLASFRFRSRYVFYHLLYACGLRVSEGIRLATSDYSAGQRTLFIQPSKFHKDRLIPIGRRAASNLEHLLELRQRRFGIPPAGPFFLILPQGRPYQSIWAGGYFRELLQRLDIYRPEVIRQGCAHGAPHLHDLRRAFAVHRLMRWYRERADVDAKLPLLATYMGHGHFGYTKTYLTLTQELLREAGSRFARGFDRLDWLTHDSDIR